MRGRIVFIVIAALVVAAIAALNWPEFTRAEPLSFGVATARVPVGLLMLVLIGIVLAVFLVSSAIQESRYLLDHRRHSRALQAQRELAEKAETSRFTDLRQHFDSHLREVRQRDQVVATEFEKRLMHSHNELRAHLDRMHHAILARLAEIETRMPAGAAERVATTPVDVPPQDRVPL
jgi:DNA anti-recombination protein RmuC